MSNFNVYKIPGTKNQNKFFFVINPAQSVVKTAVKPQYFVIADLDSLKAYEGDLTIENESGLLVKLHFVDSLAFLGESRVSAV